MRDERERGDEKRKEEREKAKTRLSRQGKRKNKSMKR